MLKINKLSDLILRVFKANNNEVFEGSSSRINETIKNLFKSKKLKNHKFKNLMYIKV